MSPLLIGGIVETVGKLADDLFTSDKERLDAEIELRRVGIEAAKIDAGLLSGQQDINKVEAAHASVFVAGWRPAVGWVSVAALGYQFILYPLLTWAWAWMQSAGWVDPALRPPPLLDVEALLVLLTGMLGIAGARTFEKVKGVSK
jgi:hypothetical protein